MFDELTVGIGRAPEEVVFVTRCSSCDQIACSNMQHLLLVTVHLFPGLTFYILPKLKRNKTVGPDGTTAETLYLSILFSWK